VGGAVGGFVALSATCFGIFFIWRKLKKDKEVNNPEYALAYNSGHTHGNHIESWQDYTASYNLQPIEVEAKHGQSEANETTQIHEVSA
tara:strand:+ start:3136 stop:3399 length:264 start_codon:yes stop_codon:yes gene_type:complete